MNELQERLLLLLKELDTICKKHNITYYIDGGSAIGAIRHNGFIPWDDDIDVVMYRDEYEKFCSIAKVELRNQYFLTKQKSLPASLQAEANLKLSTFFMTK